MTHVYNALRSRDSRFLEGRSKERDVEAFLEAAEMPGVKPDRNPVGFMATPVACYDVGRSLRQVFQLSGDFLLFNIQLLMSHARPSASDNLTDREMLASL